MHKQFEAIRSQGCEMKVVSPVPWSPFPINRLTRKWDQYSRVPSQQTIESMQVFCPRYLEFPRGFFLSSSGVSMYHGIRNAVRSLYKEFPFVLIHAHMALPDGYAGMLLAQDCNKPLVVTFQATDLDITAKRNSRCARVLQQVFSTAKRVISPSPRLAQALGRAFGIESVMIGYGIDQNEACLRFTDNELQHRYDRRRLLLSVSRLMPSKGIDLNLMALKQLVHKYPDLVYLIVGEGLERQAVERLVRELNLTDRVEFIGQLPHNQVMEYISICDVFTLPSWQETFGLVYVEAMAHGKPVIGVQGQGVDGIVTHRETGMLVKPRDVGSLVEALDYLLSHPEEARMMGERARKLVLENYTWEKNAEKTIEVYKEVLNVS
jgi:teichuronic acid biosynthesis glycosyltransferase TuaC